jgi:crotonobetaine/carnitine-CoA ligase
VDADGWFHFVDRLGDRIRRRAENIASCDIESAAATHPAVLECAAIGVPSGFESDDDIKLFVVLRPDAHWTAPDMLAHLVRLLPHYMVPRYIQTIDRLPRTPTNKVRKAPLYAVEGDAWDRKAAGIALLDVARRADIDDGLRPMDSST